MNQTGCQENSPDSLFDICLDFCIQNLEKTICDHSTFKNTYTLKDGIILSHIISQSLFNKCIESGVIVNRNALSIFREANQTRLKRLHFNSIVDLLDDDLEWFLREHCPTELYIGSHVPVLTHKALKAINTYGRNIVGLFILNSAFILEYIYAVEDEHNRSSSVSQPCLETSNLKFLSLNRLDVELTEPIDLSLGKMVKLTSLDLSNSDILVENMNCFKHLTLLQKLNLHSVPISDLESAFKVIAEAKSIRILDLGQSRSDETLMYEGDVHSNMRHLVTSLPHLNRLEIAGTNLAGRLEDVPVSHRPEKCRNIEEEKTNKKEFAIPGLEGRQMEYLGLLNCAHNACEREALPAKQVTGDADESQILLSVQAYIERQDLLLMSLNHLFHLFKYSECKNHRIALEGILAAMKTYKDEQTIQISGSATLFYIVKGDCKHFFNTKTKKELVKVLLDAMEIFNNENTMLRNGCLTLCHFKIPQDVMHSYERLVSILLRIVHSPHHAQEAFVQRISIYLLNSLACQVDHREKELVGKLGAFKTMLSLIREKLSRNECDEVMEVAWSMMWNVTDETAINCERYLMEDGMNIFMKCRQAFPSEEELLRNMMGLLGNVAEVDYLRSKLLTSQYVQIFSELLESSSDGIEVSYNACGVLSHLMSDGPEVWKIKLPSRHSVLQKMVEAISRWKLDTRRNINYRSFQPILRLLPNFSTPQVQHWAVWALCNLTKMYRSKYCPLLESENGLELLEMLHSDQRPYHEIKSLAKQVLKRCRQFKDNPESSTDDERMDETLDYPIPMILD